jgi:hypothetical protein
MDELTLITSFEADVPADAAARAAARSALLGHIERRRVPLWRRRRVAVGLIALTALAVAAAALGGRLLDLFEGKPAPPAVKRELRREIAGLTRIIDQGNADWPRPGGYRFSRTRGLVAVPTSRGPVYVWALLTGNGNVCAILQGATRGQPHVQTGMCIGRKTLQPPVLWGLASVPFGNPSAPATATEPILYGHVTPSVRSLELRLASGRTGPVRIVEGFFAVAVPRAQEEETLVARGDDGSEIDREHVPVAVEPGQPLLPVFGRARILVEINMRGGEPLALDLAPNNHGALCEFVWGGGTGRSYCPPPGLPSTPRSERIDVGFGETTSLAPERYLYGDAGTRTATLELVFADGSKVSVPTADGWMLYELRAGGRVEELVARDRLGRVVDRQRAGTPVFPGG